MKLIEQILDKSNVRIALEKVIANKDAAGIDGMKAEVYVSSVFLRSLTGHFNNP